MRINMKEEAPKDLAIPCLIAALGLIKHVPTTELANIEIRIGCQEQEEEDAGLFSCRMVVHQKGLIRFLKREPDELAGIFITEKVIHYHSYRLYMLSDISSILERLARELNITRILVRDYTTDVNRENLGREIIVAELPEGERVK